jgi:hypothetical protein
MPNDDRENSDKRLDGSEKRRNDAFPKLELLPSTQQEMLATLCLALIYVEKEIEERQVLVQQLNDELGSLLNQVLTGECSKSAK